MAERDKTVVDLAFEREKWEADVRLREGEIAVKRAELELKRIELDRSKWTNPLVLAVLAAALAAGGSAVVALINGSAQRLVETTHNDAQVTLERFKVDGQQKVEEGKAEAARILEVIKTADPDKAAENLSFLLKSGLIENDVRRQKLAEFLKQRKSGEGPTIAPPGPTISPLTAELDSTAPNSVEGDWQLLERYDFDGDQLISPSSVHLEGQSDLKGKMTYGMVSQTASISGYYRQGRLSLTYASTDPKRIGYGTIVLSSVRTAAGDPRFLGVLIGNHCFKDGTCGMLACPAVLIKTPISASIDSLPKELPNSACSR